MKNFKLLGLALLATMAITAVFGSGNASATALYKNTAPSSNDLLAIGTELTMSLKSGTSLLVKDEFGITEATCTGSEIKGKTESSAKTSITMSLSTLGFSLCTDNVTVLKPGKLHIDWISGTTNGTVSWSEAEITIISTAFGSSVICKTGTGTTIGTLTGAKTSTEAATLDLNAKISCGVLGATSWTGTYSVTTPTGLVVEEKAPPATQLYKNTAPSSNDLLGIGTELTMSLKSGTSLLVKDEFEINEATCTGSEIKGKTEANVKTTSLPMPISTLSFSSCTDKLTVLKPGRLSIDWISESTNGKVSWSESEITIISTAFGASVICKTGTGTTIGTLTGAKTSTETATLDVNAKISCGILGLATWTGTYSVTSPTGVVVEFT
jgi:hypothetical protein